MIVVLKSAAKEGSYNLKASSCREKQYEEHDLASTMHNTHPHPPLPWDESIRIRVALETFQRRTGWSTILEQLWISSGFPVLSRAEVPGVSPAETVGYHGVPSVLPTKTTARSKKP